MSEQIRQAGQEAKEGLGQLKDDLGQMKDHARETGERLAEHGKQLGQDLGRQAKEKVDHCMSSAREYAREKPLVVLAAAFGAGLAAGLLLRLSRH